MISVSTKCLISSWRVWTFSAVVMLRGFVSLAAGSQKEAPSEPIDDYHVYDGQSHGLSVSVSDEVEGSSVLYASSPDGPYGSTCPTFVNAGTYPIWYVVNSSNYPATTNQAIVTISPCPIMSYMIDLGYSTASYTGEAVVPPISVTCGEQELVQGVDYDYYCSGNVNPGSARGTVVGKGNFCGQCEFPFVISKQADTVQAAPAGDKVSCVVRNYIAEKGDSLELYSCHTDVDWLTNIVVTVRYLDVDSNAVLDESAFSLEYCAIVSRFWSDSRINQATRITVTISADVKPNTTWHTRFGYVGFHIQHSGIAQMCVRQEPMRGVLSNEVSAFGGRVGAVHIDRPEHYEKFTDEDGDGSIDRFDKQVPHSYTLKVKNLRVTEPWLSNVVLKVTHDGQDVTRFGAYISRFSDSYETEIVVYADVPGNLTEETRTGLIQFDVEKTGFSSLYSHIPDEKWTASVVVTQSPMWRRSFMSMDSGWYAPARGGSRGYVCTIDRSALAYALWAEGWSDPDVDLSDWRISISAPSGNVEAWRVHSDARFWSDDDAFLQSCLQPDGGCLQNLGKIYFGFSETVLKNDTGWMRVGTNAIVRATLYSASHPELGSVSVSFNPLVRQNSGRYSLSYVETDDGVRITGLDEVFVNPKCDMDIDGFLQIPETIGGKPVCAIEGLGVRAIDIREIIFPSGLTEIGDNAFSYCEMQSLVVPDGVRNIGHEAFGPSTTSVRLPSSLTNIANDCFAQVDTQNLEILVDEGAEDVIAGLINLPGVPIRASALAGNGSIAVPKDWSEGYAGFVSAFGSNFADALSRPTGKHDANGASLQVWQDFVAGTDPTDKDNVFKASITTDANGNLIISYTPKLSETEAAKRKYTTWGKVKLHDEKWVEIPAGHEDDYNFFKVTVEMR